MGNGAKMPKRFQFDFQTTVILLFTLLLLTAIVRSFLNGD